MVSAPSAERFYDRQPAAGVKENEGVSIPMSSREPVGFGHTKFRGENDEHGRIAVDDGAIVTMLLSAMVSEMSNFEPFHRRLRSLTVHMVERQQNAFLPTSDGL